jgi:hypothetical protein
MTPKEFAEEFLIVPEVVLDCWNYIQPKGSNEIRDILTPMPDTTIETLKQIWQFN